MFDPQSFLDLAEALLKDRSYHEETKSRTSIGRAYYAIFLNVRETLPRRIKSQARGSTHLWLIDLLKTSQTNGNRRFGFSLQNLRDDRNKADYELDPFYGPTETALRLIKAKMLWNDICVFKNLALGQPPSILLSIVAYSQILFQPRISGNIQIIQLN
jgi:uncharacterized protein (UPF0332 family)